MQNTVDISQRKPHQSLQKIDTPESAKDRQCLKADLHIYIPPLYRTDYRVCDRLE